MRYQENSIEAVIRCIIYAAVADRELSETELRAFIFLPLRKLSEKIGTTEFSEDMYGAIIEDVKEASNPDTKLIGLDAKKQYIDQVSSKITDPELQKTTIDYSLSTASADTLVAAEDYVIKRFRKNWSISS